MDDFRDFGAFEAHNNSIWANMLIGEFYEQNRIVREHLHRLLATPNFQINKTQKWGSWDPASRTVSISYELVRNYSWDAVVHTLKHEMAHMIVDEIFKGGYTAHGEAFKKACDIMGIDDDTTHSDKFKAEYSLPEKDKIVDRIYKLFALGESSFEHESKVAIAKAYELMMKYNISSLQPGQKKIFTCRPVGLRWGKIPAYIKRLANVVGNYYFVKHIYMHDGGRTRHIEFFGEPHNLDIAEYVFHYLINEGEQKWKEFQGSKAYKERHNDPDPDDYYYYHRKRRPAVYSKAAFLLGLYDGFSETLKTQDTVVQSSLGDSCKALVQQNDKILDEHYREKYKPKKWHSSRGGNNTGGYSTGVKAGRGITIRSGVVRSSHGRPLQLSS